jgi:hypothetical protein
MSYPIGGVFDIEYWPMQMEGLTRPEKVEEFIGTRMEARQLARRLNEQYDEHNITIKWRRPIE